MIIFPWLLKKNKMKILIPLTYISVYGKITNPFVSSLAKGLEECGNFVICSLDDFWQDFRRYDVIFIQWPDIFTDYVNNFGLENFRNHLNTIKQSGVKIVVTCHNLHPHNCNTQTTSIYHLVYSKADAFHHLGGYSFNLLSHQYPKKFHFIVPHHIADELFQVFCSKEQAKEKLQIPLNNVVISSFGAFRNTEEEKLFKNMADDIGNKQITYLAPRMIIGHLYHGRQIGKTIECLKKTWDCKRLNIKTKGSFMSNDEQSLWLAASDIVFIQRKEILNSGNIPLAFSQGKIVVGPNLGATES